MPHPTYNIHSEIKINVRKSMLILMLAWSLGPGVWSLEFGTQELN